jgi:hypothetical protein
MKSKTLRYFLYLDVGLVGAFLEQLEGGKIQTTEYSYETEQKVQGGLNIALMQIGGSGNRSTSHKETRTVFYDLYNRLEKALRSEHKLKDLSNLKNKSKINIEENCFFIARGCITFSPNWSNWQSMGYILNKVNEWLAGMQSSETDQQIQEAAQKNQLTEGVGNIVLPNKNPIIQLPPIPLGSLLPKLPDEPPKEIRSLIKPETIDIELSIPGRNLNIKATGSLDNFAVEQMPALYTGQKLLTAYIMGLSSIVSGESIDSLPIAIFTTI